MFSVFLNLSSEKNKNQDFIIRAIKIIVYPKIAYFLMSLSIILRSNFATSADYIFYNLY